MKLSLKGKLPNKEGRQKDNCKIVKEVISKPTTGKDSTLNLRDS